MGLLENSWILRLQCILSPQQIKETMELKTAICTALDFVFLISDPVKILCVYQTRKFMDPRIATHLSPQQIKGTMELKTVHCTTLEFVFLFSNPVQILCLSDLQVFGTAGT
jgi:hypothetical protein